jgi:hypothetical protein
LTPARLSRTAAHAAFSAYGRPRYSIDGTVNLALVFGDFKRFAFLADIDLNPASPAAALESPPSWSLTASVAARINVAFHQNAVPSIGEVAVTALADAANVSVQVSATPAFLKPTTIRIDSLASGAARKIAPVPVELDLAFLSGLSEAVRAEVNFRVRVGDNEVFALAVPERFFRQANGQDLRAHPNSWPPSCAPTILP